jgi:hypothetical protein
MVLPIIIRIRYEPHDIRGSRRRRLDEAAGLLVGAEQRFDFAEQFLVARTSLGEESSSRFRARSRAASRS